MLMDKLACMLPRPLGDEAATCKMMVGAVGSRVAARSRRVLNQPPIVSATNR